MRTQKKIISTGSVMLAAVLSTGIQRPAQSQTQVGAGTALDKNLRVGSGGINAARPQENYRDRNLIITGDVAAGRGFRGAVGYTAPSDFRGHLGSNDLFQFRAGSAYSSPELFQLGNTFNQLRYGQDNSLLLDYRKFGSYAAASIRVNDPVSANVESAAGQRMDRTTLAMSTATILEQSVEPRVVGVGINSENKTMLFSTSTLRGLTLEPADQSVNMIGLSSYDGASVRRDMEAGKPTTVLGGNFDTTFKNQIKSPAPNQVNKDLRLGTPENKDAKLDAQVKPDTVSASIDPDYKKILESIAKRYADAENVDLKVSEELLSHLDEDYKALRDKLTGQVDNKIQQPSDGISDLAPGAAKDRKDDKTSKSKTDTTAPGSGKSVGETGLPDLSPKGLNPKPDGMLPSAADKKAKDEKRAAPSIEQYGTILRHGQRVDKLSGPDQDRFNELMASAEQKLKEGDYFWAERRFERALRFTPGHPMASAGAAHSQIGAGLYLSASYSLRALLANQPAMIDTTYSPELLPSRERLNAAITRLNEHLAESDLPARDRAAYAFLLAYIGHQVGNRQYVTQGLDILTKLEPNDDLVKLVKSIWLGGNETAKPAPDPQK